MRVISEATLLLTKGLSAMAYTGVLLVLPPVLAARYWRLVEEVSEDVIAKTLAMWAEDIELIEELILP